MQVKSSRIGELLVKEEDASVAPPKGAIYRDVGEGAEENGRAKLNGGGVHCGIWVRGKRGRGIPSGYQVPFIKGRTGKKS